MAVGIGLWLLGRVMLSVQLARRLGVMTCMQVMPMSGVCVFSGSGDIIAFVVFRSLTVMVRRLFMVLGCFFVVLCYLIGVRHELLSQSGRGRSARAKTLSSTHDRTTNP